MPDGDQCGDDFIRHISNIILQGPKYTLLKNYKETVKLNKEITFANLSNDSSVCNLFPTAKYVPLSENLDSKSLELERYDHVFRIQDLIPDKKIIIDVAPASDPNNSIHRLEWILSPVDSDHTEIKTSFYALGNLPNTKNAVDHPKVPFALLGTVVAGVGLLSGNTANAELSSGSITSVLLSTSTLKIISIVTILSFGAIFGSIYVNSYNSLLEMESLITDANKKHESAQREGLKFYNSQHDKILNTFSKVDKLFFSTQFSPDHIAYAEYLHLQSMIGMANSLQIQSNFGQIESYSDKSEEYYLYAITLYEGKHNTENAWIGRGINAIYETPEKTIEICSIYHSVNSHMCQGEAYSYMYVIDKAPLEKAEEQFEIALDKAESESQKLKIQDDIKQIYNYYKLP